MACAPPIWKTSGARPSSRAVPKISATGFGRRDADVRHARHLRRDHGHHQRRGQRIAARRECTPPRCRAAARSGRGAAPGRICCDPLARHLQFGVARILAAAVVDGVAELRRQLARGSLQLRFRHAHATCASKPSNLRAYSSSARSPRLRTASRIGRTTASASANRAARARQQAADVFAFEDPDHRTILFSGYSTIPCAARLLQPRNDVAHRGFIENGVHRQPLLVAQVRDGRPLQRRQHRRAPRSRSFLCTLSISPTLPSALMAPSSSILMSSSLRRFHSSAQDCLIGDQLRVRFEHGVDDLELVGAQRRAGLGHFDDGIGQHRRLHFGGAPTEFHLGLDAVRWRDSAWWWPPVRWR